jgi:hypothetical protein
MQTHRLFSTAATLLGLCFTAARADLYMELGINKRFYQTNAISPTFDHGEMNLYLRDGNILLASCTSDPELFFYGPHLLCPLGITGFVAFGDFNRDGVSDANQYWSIEAVAGAQVIAPGYPQYCALTSGPPSKLPRPLKVFRDGTVTVFHDLRSSQVTQYNIALYEMIRRYGSVRQVESIVTAGAVTVAGDIAAVVSGADFPVPVTVTIPVEVEVDDQTGEPIPVFAETWAEGLRNALQNEPAISAFYAVGGTDNSITLTEVTPNGNDSTLLLQIILPAVNPAGGTIENFVPINSFNTTTGTLVKSPAAALKQMNEELITGRYIFSFPSRLNPTTVPVNMAVNIVPNLEPLGSNPRQKSVGFRFTSGIYDDGFYQMDPRLLTTVSWTGNDPSNIIPTDRFYFSILNESEDRIEFPPTVPQTPVVLANPAVQSYTVPPGFFQVGDQNVLDLRYQRTLRITGVSYDRSKREYRLRVKFVDSYLGWGQGAFTLGSTNDTSPDGDFDGDGMTNIEEFAYQFPTQSQIIAGAKDLLPPYARFMRLLETEPETVSDVAVKPTGVIGPELDADNHVVFKVPFRALTGNTLKYDFVEVTTTTKNGKTKTKTKKIKPGAKWLVSYEDGVSTTRTVRAQVEIINVLTGAVSAVRIYPGPGEPNLVVPLTKQYIVLRSKDPVDPASALPTLDVKLTAVNVQ